MFKIDFDYELGYRMEDGRAVVIPGMEYKARETARRLRSNARELDEQATRSGDFRRKVLLRLAREARSLADKLEKQCDRVKEGVA